MTGKKKVIASTKATKVNDIEVLLNNIETYISKHAVLPEGASIAITLWCLSGYSINQFGVFPRLTLISPEKRCGKSTVLDLIWAFSNNAIITSNMTPASIYRLINESQPTLIIDEADTFIKGKAGEMVGIINSGHAKSRAYVSRCVGDDYKVKQFSTWTPMAIASIGDLPPTIMDRSIVIPLRRKTKNETVKRMRTDLFVVAKSERDKLLKWSTDNAKSIASNSNEPPNLGNDRAVDNWLPLFTIANQVSPTWLKKCETAYKALTDTDEEPELTTQLLADIRDIFNSQTDNKIPSADMVKILNGEKDKPWCEIRNGSPLSQNGLANMLKPYKIKPKVVRYNGSTPRGYELDQFRDAFDRYLL